MASKQHYLSNKDLDVIINVFRIFEIRFRSGVMAAEVTSKDIL